MSRSPGGTLDDRGFARQIGLSWCVCLLLLFVSDSFQTSTSCSNVRANTLSAVPLTFLAQSTIPRPVSAHTLGTCVA
eukprot:m.140434 g.140434  ORF g.140434 m.140434 type:complete len:77 (-) comp52568_c2_seq64:362-592(-)